MVAKMAATIDHVTNGRFAMNVVCGWFKNEFDMFGAHMRRHRRPLQICHRVARFRAAGLDGNDDEFNFRSEKLRSHRSLEPAEAVAEAPPPIMNAGGSPAAQDFTTRYCDMNFVILKDRTHLAGAKAQIDHLTMARSHGRETQFCI